MLWNNGLEKLTSMASTWRVSRNLPLIKSGLMHLDVSNPDSYETAVELLVPVLQRRGLMWDDYAVPGGTFRENLYGIPGQTSLPEHHPGSKFKWNALATHVNGDAKEYPDAATNGVKGEI